MHAATAYDKDKESYTSVLKINASAAKTLLKAGANANRLIETVPNFPTSYLIIVATNNDSIFAKSLLQHKAKIDWHDAFQAIVIH